MTVHNAYWLLIFACFSGMSEIHAMDQRPQADHVITFFIRPCFCSNVCIEDNNLAESLQDPGFLNRNHMEYCLKTTRHQGINAVYYGMATHTNAHGQIIFPRKQLEDDVLLVVTDQPHPLISQGQTVNKWVVDPKTPVAFYSYAHVKQNGDLLWHAQQIPTPADRVIPAQAIIIIARPDEIIIHEGISSTVQGPNIILPPIYTKKAINLDKDALSFLNINKYFSQVTNVVNYSSDRYAIMPQP